jgi:two-component system response regulator MprA
MEGEDGSIAVCRELRRGGVATPILILAQRGSIDDVVKAIDAGADDFMIEPVEVELLIARLRAFLRRTAFQATASSSRAPPNWL